MPISSAQNAPRYAPLTEAHVEYHLAACLRDSIRWTYRQARSGSPSHPLSETPSSSRPTQFHELLRRVRRAHILRRATERAASTTGQTPLLRRAVARRRRAQWKKARKERTKFLWGRRLERMLAEVLADRTLRKSPYAVLAELRKRGANAKELTTGIVKRRLKAREYMRKMKGLPVGLDEHKGRTDKEQSSRMEKICAMLPAICREKPTLDEPELFGSELLR